MKKFKQYWQQSFSDWAFICRREIRNIVKDEGVLVFFLVVPLLYPLLYTFIYTDEVVREVPVAVTDDCHTPTSREYLRRVDATAEVRVVARCADMAEARRLAARRDIHGIMYIPEDFSRQLAGGRQTGVSIFCDMSGLLYYKALLTANTNVSLAMNADIKAVRAGGATAEQNRVAAHPIAYEEVSLYNPQNGFATFLIPAVLMLILQQTLLLGVGISAGTAREHNRSRELIPINSHYSGLLRIVLGKAFTYLLVYIPVSVYVLGVIPHLFSLNQIGNPGNLALFVLSYLTACIFFAMTVSALVRQREYCILIIVFTSLPLLFISGVSWPGTAVPPFWKAVAHIFPSTPGINGFLKINNTGASLSDIASECRLLQTQAAVYFLTTCLIYRQNILAARRRIIEQYNTLRAARAGHGHLSGNGDETSGQPV